MMLLANDAVLFRGLYLRPLPPFPENFLVPSIIPCLSGYFTCNVPGNSMTSITRLALPTPLFSRLLTWSFNMHHKSSRCTLSSDHNLLAFYA